MTYRTDQPKPTNYANGEQLSVYRPKVHPPVKRLDTATANRIRTVAQDYLALGDYAARMDAADRALMAGEIVAQIPAGVALPDLSGKSDTYLSARYVACLERVRADVADPLPADGMVSGSTVAAEVKGPARELRRRMNSYLCTAFTQLLAEQRASGVSSLPNGCDVEDRARQLAKQDPKGLFTDGKNV